MDNLPEQITQEELMDVIISSLVGKEITYIEHGVLDDGETKRKLITITYKDE